MRNFILQMTATILFGLAIVTPIYGQRDRERDRERERLENERDLELRSWNLKMLSLAASKAGEKRPKVQQAFAQLQEDYTQIQTVNRNLGRAVIGNKTLDLRFVAKSLSEIKKRAERLNTNLKLPEPEKAGDANAGPLAGHEQLKPSLLKLVKLVFRFVDNPFFKEASVVDTHQTKKARRDLEDIIEMSEQLKKDSERFDKAVREKGVRP